MLATSFVVQPAALSAEPTRAVPMGLMAVGLFAAIFAGGLAVGHKVARRGGKSGLLDSAAGVWEPVTLSVENDYDRFGK